MITKPSDDQRIFDAMKRGVQHRRVCAWCNTVVTEGALPTTHTMCELCSGRMRAEAEAHYAARLAVVHPQMSLLTSLFGYWKVITASVLNAARAARRGK